MATKEATAPRVCCSPHIPAAGEGVGDVAPDLWKAKEGARAGGEGGGRTCVPKAHRGCSLGEGRGSGKPLGSGHREK